MIDRIILEKNGNLIIIIGEIIESLIKYCQELNIENIYFTSIPEINILANTNYIFIHRNYLDHNNENNEFFITINIFDSKVFNLLKLT